MTKLYPMKFVPILKPLIWGGNEIRKFKNLTSVPDGIGESWELSGVEGSVSVVENGALAGTNLNELIQTFGAQLLGKANLQRFGGQFPLLIKFIDAKNDLSIQVHPNDELAQKRHNSMGKTEMWYVVNATPKARIISGFAQKLTEEQYEQSVQNGTFTDTLATYEARVGDVFMLPAGRVHAIGAGTFIAEIQQTSNITYRIYDYGRTDKNGNQRELHIDEAKEAIDFEVQADYRTAYQPAPNEAVLLESNRHFTTHLLELSEPFSQTLSETDSFVIFICVQGSAVLTDEQNNTISIRRGETVLLPATTKSVQIDPTQSVKLLETYV